MKKKQLITAAAIIMGSALSLFAQGTVSSINAAGYIKVDTEGGKFYFVQNPFTKFDNSTSFTVDEILGSSLAGGSQVFVWDAANQQYVINSFAFGSWSPNSSIERGQGFFVRPANAAPAASMFLHGQVPGATTFATSGIALEQGFSAIGWPYPTATTLEDSGVATGMGPGDQVFIWDTVAQGYTIVSFAFGSFNPANTVVNPGAAVFIRKNGAASSVSAAVPYSWPNN